MLNLTKEERMVILFVLALWMTGMGIQALVKRIPGARKETYLRNLGKINLNSCRAELLETIPGIGKTSSHRIIEYREHNDGFSDLDELANIKGLKKKLVPQMKDYVYIE
jgi:DNA uptake protein ComE-like DNA-binding protein